MDPNAKNATTVFIVGDGQGLESVIQHLEKRLDDLREKAAGVSVGGGAGGAASTAQGSSSTAGVARQSAGSTGTNRGGGPTNMGKAPEFNQSVSGPMVNALSSTIDASRSGARPPQAQVRNSNPAPPIQFHGTPTGAADVSAQSSATPGSLSPAEFAAMQNRADLRWQGQSIVARQRAATLEGQDALRADRGYRQQEQHEIQEAKYDAREARASLVHDRQRRIVNASTGAALPPGVDPEVVYQTQTNKMEQRAQKSYEAAKSREEIADFKGERDYQRAVARKFQGTRAEYEGLAGYQFEERESDHEEALKKLTHDKNVASRKYFQQANRDLARYRRKDRFGKSAPIAYSLDRKPLDNQDIDDYQTQVDNLLDEGYGPDDAQPFSNFTNDPGRRWNRFRQSPLGRYSFSAARGMLYAATSAGTAYAATQLHEAQTGRTDFMGQAGAAGQFWGGLGGALIGSAFGPFGGIIGAGVGGQLGQMLGQYTMAGDVRTMDIQRQLMPVGELRAEWLRDPYSGSPVGWDRVSRAFDPVTHGSSAGGGTRQDVLQYNNPALSRAYEIGRRYSGDDTRKQTGVAGVIARSYFGLDNRGRPIGEKAYEFGMNAEELSNAYSGLYQSFVGSGLNPENIIQDSAAESTIKTGRKLRVPRLGPDGKPVMIDDPNPQHGHWEIDSRTEGTMTPNRRVSRYTGSMNATEQSTSVSTPLRPRNPRDLGEPPATLEGYPNDPEMAGNPSFLEWLQRRSGRMFQSPPQRLGTNLGTQDATPGAPTPPSYQTRGTASSGGQIEGSVENPTFTQGARTYKFVRDKIAQMDEIDETKDVRQTEGLTITDFLARQSNRYFGRAGGESVIKEISPILGSLYEMGGRDGPDLRDYRGNMIDELMRFGPQATAHYQKLLTPFGEKSPMDLPDATALFAYARQNQRRMQMSAYTRRGRGSELEQTTGDMIDHIKEAYPDDARNSLTVKRLEYERADFRKQRYHEQDVLGFDLPMLHLDTEERIREVMPFSPGSNMELSMRRLQTRAPYIRQRIQRFNRQMADGELSEDEQYQQASEIEGLRVSQYQDIGRMAQGGVNRIAAASAGMTSYRGRFDSLDLAQTALWGSGHPRQDLGFRNGMHLQQSQNWFNQFATPDFNPSVANNPVDRNSTINSNITLNSIDQGIRQLVTILSRTQGGVGGNPANGMSAIESRNRVQGALALGGDGRQGYGRAG